MPWDVGRKSGETSGDSKFRKSLSGNMRDYQGSKLRNICLMGKYVLHISLLSNKVSHICFMSCLTNVHTQSC